MIELKYLPNIKNSISKKMIIYIILFSSIITLLLTALQLYIDYAKDRDHIVASMHSLEGNRITSIINSLWVHDEEVVRIHLGEILNQSDIKYLAIREDGRALFRVGNPISKNVITHSIPLAYSFKGRNIDLGTLYIEASLEAAMQRLSSRLFIILGSQAFLILLLTFFMFMVFHFLVGRHLETMANYARALDSQKLDVPLNLGRQTPEDVADYDELDSVTSAINLMRTKLLSDIQNQKDSAEALRRSEIQFRSIFETSHDAIILADEEGLIVSVNNATLVMFGYQNGDLAGKSIGILMPERYRARHAAGIKRFKASGKSKYLGETLPFEGLRKDGSEFPLELNVSQWENADGMFFGGIIRDVANLKKAEAEKSAAYENFKTLVDSMEALIYVADMDTYELLLVNKYGREVWGDIEGQVCWQALQENQDGPCAFCTNNKLTDQDGRAKESYVWEFQNTVNKRWYECRDQAIPWSGDKLVRMEIATDITERKEAEAARKKLEARLRQSQKMEAIGTLAGGIAHDFNNILVPILAYTEMVRNTLPRESESSRDLGQVIQAANRARDLVKQILTFSREREEALVPLKVAPIIKEIIKLLQSSFPSTITIVSRINAKKDTVLADPIQIHQIMMNLCTNALHAMRDTGGILEVVLENSKPEQLPLSGNDNADYLIIRVIDTGCGMDKETRERIFEPYFTTKEPGEGTGLGLAVTHGIVTGMKGAIKVFSDPGQGTTFTIYIPLVHPRAFRGDSVIDNELLNSKTNRNILLVDDEAPVLETLKRMLESFGHKVTARTSSIEALEAFRAKPGAFDLVVTDMTMPNMTGDQLAQEIISIRPDMPIILCTGYSRIMNEEEALKIGIKGFVMKPVVRYELAQKIVSVLP